MRSKILALLKNAGAYRSGEEIARQLDVSRTAVWKHIRELKADGYKIESHPRNGYRLVDTPDLLLPNEIKDGLKTKWLGHNIEYKENTESTNQILKKLYVQGTSDGTIAVSEAQTKGKGRLSRGWYSPSQKGIWFSVLLKPDILPQEAPKCTLLAAVAIVKAIENVTGVKCGIKWPNDILYEGRKMVGILTEMSAEMEGIHYIIIGMGINVNLLPEDVPDELKEIVMSLQMIMGKKIERLSLLREILLQLELLYEEMLSNGFRKIFEQWRNYSITLGQEVNVIGINETFTGKALDIDTDGALLIETAAGVRRVLAGDVSIRPKK